MDLSMMGSAKQAAGDMLNVPFKFLDYFKKNKSAPVQSQPSSGNEFADAVNAPVNLGGKTFIQAMKANTDKALGITPVTRALSAAKDVLNPVGADGSLKPSKLGLLGIIALGVTGLVYTFANKSKGKKF